MDTVAYGFLLAAGFAAFGIAASAVGFVVVMLFLFILGIFRR